ncbi:hypothetical protein BPA_0900030 (plasmid) [Borrelia parkeri SLO]|uniref:Uncharacterized protein n=1 Tax=Borrelia parkeri SLO TaxID=1313294 RepID=W5STD7_BORPR|nr:hypothetical protein BPA_0900030 [Borrelia parkeri SLO]
MISIPDFFASSIIALTSLIIESTLVLSAATAAAALAVSPMSEPSLVTSVSLVKEVISCSKTSLAPLIALLTASIVLLLAFFASDISPDSSFNLSLVSP